MNIETIEIPIRIADENGVLRNASVPKADLANLFNAAKSAHRDLKGDVFRAKASKVKEEKAAKDRGGFSKCYDGLYEMEIGLSKIEFAVWSMVKKYMVRDSCLMYMTGKVASKLLKKHVSQIREETHCTNALSSLCKKGFMYKLSVGTYIVNPMLVFKGDRTDFVQLFKDNNIFDGGNNDELAFNIANELFLDINEEINGIKAYIETKSRLKIFTK